MKKITLLLMLFVASIGLNAQTWDFTNTKDGWANVAATQVPMDTYWELTSKSGVKNPGLKLTDATELAKIDVTTVHILAITMKNHSVTGPLELRTAATAENGTIYLSTVITTGDTEYKTYYVDFSVQASKWTGAVSEMKLLFKAAGNTDFIGTGNEIFDIDKIEMLDAIPTTEQNTYTFDSDEEGFTAVNGSFVWSTGIVTYTPVATKYAKLEQVTYHHVDATNNKTVNIKLTNNSPVNDQLRFVYQLADGSNAATLTQTMTTSDTEEKTYQFDLSGYTEWTGNKTFFVGIGSLADGKAQDDGTVIFNSIIFDNSPVLSNESIAKDDVQLSIYPNPVGDMLSVKASAKVNSLQVYNVTGQEVLKANKASINTSSLSKGVYILKVSQEGGAISTKRFIKE